MLLLVYTMYIIYIYFLLFSQNNGKNSRDLHAAINLHAIHGCDVITDSQKKKLLHRNSIKIFYSDNENEYERGYSQSYVHTLEENFLSNVNY